MYIIRTDCVLLFTGEYPDLLYNTGENRNQNNVSYTISEGMFSSCSEGLQYSYDMNLAILISFILTLFYHFIDSYFSAIYHKLNIAIVLASANFGRWVLL